MDIDDIVHIVLIATRLSVIGLPPRKARAVQDAAILASLFEKKPERREFYAMLLIKASLFVAERAIQWIPCVVCAAVPPTDWTALALHPENAGMHCAAHKAAFHSVCLCSSHCCEEPYDPDRDYEFRYLNEPQE